MIHVSHTPTQRKFLPEAFPTNHCGDQLNESTSSLSVLKLCLWAPDLSIAEASYPKFHGRTAARTLVERAFRDDRHIIVRSLFVGFVIYRKIIRHGSFYTTTIEAVIWPSDYSAA